MNQDRVDFLNERGLGRGNSNSHVREKTEPGWLAPGQGNDGHATLTSLAGGLDDVWRLAAGAESHQHIPLVTERGDLSLEDRLVAVIVGDRGQDRRVRRQCQHRPRLSFAPEAPDELAGKMLGLGRAAAIPADQDQMAARESIDDDCGRAGDLVTVGREKRENRAQRSRPVE
jgi:hypothetical protein